MSYLSNESLKTIPSKIIHALLFGIAREEMGVKEVTGRGNNARIIEYHKSTELKASDDMTSWCSAFVNWACDQAGIPKTNKANARSWLLWGEKVTEPEIGDIVILSRGSSSWQGHVGFVAEKPTSLSPFIKVLGGNQDDSVNISSYMKARILGYRRFKA